MAKLMLKVVLTAVLAGTPLWFPGMAVAQDEASPGGIAFEMPDLKGELLGAAFDTIEEESGGAAYEFVTIDYVGGQDQLNLTNWTVCEQYPKPGDEMPETSSKITLYVKRPIADNCFS